MVLIKEREFNKQIGFFGLLMLGVGATIGAGIFVLLGEATALTGPSVVFAFVINFVIAIVIAVHYAEMAALSPVQGGGYSFIESAFGSSAYYVGWLIWFGNVAYAAFCSIAFALYVTSGTAINPIFVAILTLSAFTALNLTGVKSVIEIEKLLTVVLIGTFLVFTVRGSSLFDASNFTNIFPGGLMALLPATSLVFLCYVGFETITTISAEVKNPTRNIPRALIGSVVVSGILYISFSFVFAGAIGSTSITNPETILLEFFTTDIMQFFMVAAAVLATVSSLNIGLMAASRNAYALARDGFLPNIISKVSKRDSPNYAIVLSSLIAFLLLLSGTAVSVASISNFSYMLVVSMVCMSVIALRNRPVEGVVKRFYKVPLYPYLSYIGVIVPLILIPFLDQTALLIGAAWLIAGFFFYNIWRSEAFKQVLGRPKRK
jgi:amino acid transporter